MSLWLSAPRPLVRHLAVRPRSGLSFFSTSTFHHTRIRSTLTTSRPKRSPQPAEQSKQDVLPPTHSTPGAAASHSPKVSRITPLRPAGTQTHGSNAFKGETTRHKHSNQHHQNQKDPRQGRFNPWLHHIIESRRAAIRSFFFGTVVAAGGLGIYNYSSGPITGQWTQLQQDFFSLARASLTQSLGPSPSSDPSTPGLSNGAPRAFSGAPAEKTLSLGRFEKKIRMLSSEQVEERLAQNQRSYRIVPDAVAERKEKSKQELILGYSINQVASNNPVEDDLSAHVVRGKDGSIEKVFFGIFDGHGGWCCSQRVAQELAPTVATELETVKDRHDIMATMEAIENGFLKLDDKIVNQTVQTVLEFPSRPLACSSLLPAIAGSCALMAYVDAKEKDLYVACTGDSRAVMGVYEPSAKGGHAWKAVPLSFDQTGRNRWEVRRLQEEHPGEENTVVMRGRVLGGLEPTRAFGDARYKWTTEIQERVFQLFPSYRQPHRNFHTPPYVTAKPVVKHHKLRPEDRFLVMATDGLWDKLTSEEVVQLVGDLLDGKKGQEQVVLDREELGLIKSKIQSFKGVITGKKEDQNEDSEELTPANLPPKGPSSQIRQFTFKDTANASTHLVRNALGGGNDEKLAATLSIPAPMSRVYRDDITVTVIFFGQQDTKEALSGAQHNDGLVDII